MNVLLFTPANEKPNTELMLGILHGSFPDAESLIIDVLDENSDVRSLERADYEAVIILYTPQVEFSETLFQVIQYTGQRKPRGRFIFLPTSNGKEVIPVIFHSIRLLQLHLFYYTPAAQTPQPLESQLAAFKIEWNKFNPSPRVPETGTRGRADRSRAAGFGLILLASILILFLAGLIAVVIPAAQRTLILPTPTAVRPPAASAWWLQGTLQSTTTTSQWQVEHYYTGLQAMDVALAGDHLALSASPTVTDAVFQMDSAQAYPLDGLLSLSFSFSISKLTDGGAKNALVFGLFLNDDSSYRLACSIIPARSEGKIQCLLQDPTDTQALSDPVSLSLDTKHTAMVVFDPLTYTFQFFLDDQYYGQRAIQVVAYWRSRDFSVEVKDELQALTSGSFSSNWYALDLARRP